MGIVLAFVICCMSSAAAQQTGPPVEAHHVQSFLNGVQAVCTSAPAQACVDAGWKFAAAFPERGLSLSDIETLRRRLGIWYSWRQAALRDRDRLSIGFGLLLTDGIGVERIHGAFDADGNGLITQPELLADVNLDNRPLGEVLSDPGAVDRAGLARRLNLPVDLLNGLFR